MYHKVTMGILAHSKAIWYFLASLSFHYAIYAPHPPALPHIQENECLHIMETKVYVSYSDNGNYEYSSILSNKKAPVAI